MIDIQWPSSEKSEVVNKEMDGKYLIKSVTHQFSSSMTPSYRQLVVAMKNAYYNSDSRSLLNATVTSLETNTKKMGKG